MLRVTDVFGRQKAGFFVIDMETEKRGVLLYNSTNLRKVAEYINDFHSEVAETCVHCPDECELKIELPSEDKNEFRGFLSSLYYGESVLAEVGDEDEY